MYSEVTKLYQLVLTIPITAVSDEHSKSTLKRIKSFLKNSTTNDRFSSLSTLAIERRLLGVLVKDPTFMENVINEYAKKEDRRLELFYKQIQ